MDKNKTLIINNKKIGQKIDRMAVQIYEDCYEEKSVIIAGIAKRGYLLAEKLADAVREISHLKVELIKVVVNKDNPIESEIKLPFADTKLKNKVIILVDDVLNSGKTLIYGSRRFLRQPIKKLRTAVLIDRDHKRFPIEADFVGLSLATTMKERISVEFKKNADKVYLM